MKKTLSQDIWQHIFDDRATKTKCQNLYIYIGCISEQTQKLQFIKPYIKPSDDE